MIAEGQITLFRFPQTDQQIGKLRLALIIRRLPGQHDDWLICMVSSQLDREIPGFDEVMTPDDSDFGESGLKLSSLIRISRVAVVNGDILIGKIGQVDSQRLSRIKKNISQWIQSV
jgi:mRNA interferase MazF